MSRPLRFPSLAPNKTLSIATGAISGLNQGLNNLARLQMQRAQMKYHQAQADAMKTWRQSQAQLNEAKAAGVNTAKVHAAWLMDKYGITEGMTEKAISDTLIKNKDATPSDVQAITNWAHQRALEGAPLTPNLNVNEARAFSREGTDASRLAVADKALEGRKYTADEYGDTRVKVAEIGGRSKITAAGITAGAHGASNKADLQAMKDKAREIHDNDVALKSLDKPLGLGQTPMSDESKETLRQAYKENAIKLHSEYEGIRTRASGADQPPAHENAAPPATQAPQGRVLPAASYKDAKPGDVVQHPNGFVSVGPDGNPKTENGQVKFFHSPQEAMGLPVPTQTPQTPALPPGYSPVPQGMGPQGMIPGMEAPPGNPGPSVTLPALPGGQ